MKSLRAALYIGKVWHRRWKPKRHSLQYRVYSLLVDIDDLPALSSRLALFSHNRFNLFSIYDRDFGAGDGSPLRPWVERQLQAAGLDCNGLAIELLCYPRLLGYAFNPLSVFFCRREGGALIAILYEVHNTFGQRHCYLIPVRDGARIVEQQCAKEFYVSPFIGMEATYQFTVRPPEPDAKTGDRLVVSIHERDAEGPLLDAAFSAKRRPIDDRTLLSLLASHPMMTLKVILGIHWEALKLWLKGVSITPRPVPPAGLVTIAIDRRAPDGASS